MSSAAAGGTTTARHYQEPYDAYYAQQVADTKTSSTPNRTQPRYPNGNAFTPSSSTSQRQYQSSTNPDLTSLSAQGVAPNPAASSRLNTDGPPIQPPPRTSSQHAKSAATVSDLESSPAMNNRRNMPTQSYDLRGGTSRQTSSQRQADSAVPAPPMGSNLPRENSAIISRVITSDPSEDIEREQARLAESRGVPVVSDITPITGLGLVGNEGVDDGGRGTTKRQDFSRSDKSRKEIKFGDYVLGETLGEGEFGKVKMGWKKEGGVQVAVKLIRREKLGDNPSRLPKIYREIAILRGLQHPNIVRLHEMVETERNIGIILEYASGGELFDYILHHRYLKDHSARRLFAQLVSGVGYLHKKGIVHRDLKLENLLLDRNRNIIITDFGFANVFNPEDELPREYEYSLGDKEFVKKAGLDMQGANGFRRGDLMQTSCGSPCYAAPELVVSDSLYTGRKVDVWSCGVILYAMLAGYLPFDDDPANPEGDNINLLYKYIVSTPLTFPEYITPHARDLLRRMLVPDPRKRADLFEVARHSWLTEYEHVVGFITSSSTSTKDLANTSFNNDGQYGVPSLARSASVREPKQPHQTYASTGDAGSRSAAADRAEGTETKTPRDAKRRTVQLEYVAPQTQTARGSTLPPALTAVDAAAGHRGTPRTRVRNDNQGPIAVKSPPTVPAKDQYSSENAHATMPPPQRTGREVPRSVSDSTAFQSVQPGIGEATRPSTGGSMGTSSRLPSRGSYGQPAAATVAQTNAQGRFAQPTGPGAKQYVISGPIQQDAAANAQSGGPNMQYLQDLSQSSQRAHKRSNTLGGLGERIFGRSGSLSRRSTAQRPEKPDRSYPPTSMKEPMETEPVGRKSTDSRRSFGFGRKTSSDLPTQEKRSSRRFSLLPQGLSFKNLVGGASKDQYGDENPPPRRLSKPQTQMAFGRGLSNSPSQSTMGSNIPGMYDGQRDVRQGSPAHYAPRSAPTSRQQPSQSAPNFYESQKTYAPVRPDPATSNGPTSSPPPQESYYQMQQPPPVSVAPPSTQTYYQTPAERTDSLQQNNRRFADAYEEDTQHGGSSGAARKVMDFFRRRGKARSGDDR